MRNFNSTVCILLFALFACTDKQNRLDKTSSESQENKYNSNETYFYGGICLLTKTNLPLTGFKLDFNEKEGFIEIEEYYINGSRISRQHNLNDSTIWSFTEYTDGKITLDQDYYKNGSFSRFVCYEHDSETRHENSWYENGRKEEEKTYENGELNGKYLRWYENGQIKEISNYEKGLRIGWQREYLENGTLLYEVNLINGNGKISYEYADMYAKKNIKIEKIYIFGKEVNPPIGKKYEISDPWLDETNTLEYSFENGELNGQERGFYGEASSESKYKNGLIKEHNYKNGIKHGVYKTWNKNGILDYEAVYFYDQLDGECKSWYNNGELQHLEKYNKGKLISEKCWDENGKLMDCNDQGITH